MARFPHGAGPQRAEATDRNVLACIQTLPHNVTGGPLFSVGLGMTALFQYGALFKYDRQTDRNGPTGPWRLLFPRLPAALPSGPGTAAAARPEVRQLHFPVESRAPGPFVPQQQSSLSEGSVGMRPSLGTDSEEKGNRKTVPLPLRGQAPVSSRIAAAEGGTRPLTIRVNSDFQPLWRVDTLRLRSSLCRSPRSHRGALCTKVPPLQEVPPLPEVSGVRVWTPASPGTEDCLS